MAPLYFAMCLSDLLQREPRADVDAQRTLLVEGDELVQLLGGTLCAYAAHTQLGGESVIDQGRDPIAVPHQRDRIPKCLPADRVERGVHTARCSRAHPLNESVS